VNNGWPRPSHPRAARSRDRAGSTPQSPLRPTPLARALVGTTAGWGVVACLLSLTLPTFAEARITRIEISRVESPTFEGTAFGSVGAYEKLIGTAFGEVDPADPRDEGIVDLERAPRNAAGRIEYSTDIVILRPIDRTRGNGRLFYEPSNRGSVLSLAVLQDAPIRNDPTAAADAGNGFLFREGYTVLLSGWDVTAPAGGGRLQTTVPIATRSDGSPIVGPALEEFVIDNATTLRVALTYPAASLDNSTAALTLRRRQADRPEEIPRTDWEFVSPSSVQLLPEGRSFEQGRLYELRYVARDPKVAGLGFAAVRDLALFAKRATQDDAGHPNPMAGRAELVYGFAVSQPARFLRDFVDLGFNAGDEPGLQAFDGILNWIAGPSGGFFNFRFAQPARTHRQRIGRNYPEREFPFAYQARFDPVTRELAGRITTCRSSNTCPKLLEANSSNEYWVKGGSLLHTDTRGRDLIGLPELRYYLISSLPHQRGGGPGICQQERNPLGGGQVLRALLVALDEWVRDGRRPPASRVPRRRDGTLVPSLPQRVLGFPEIPGVTYTGLRTLGDLIFFGRAADAGVLTRLPPLRRRRPPYPVFVPATDSDGNDLAGVRIPDIAVPVGTYTGWAVRAPEFGGNDLCDQFGQFIPFAETRDERIANGDPRPSLEERYPTNAAYVRRVTRAARGLQRERLFLEEDVQRVIDAARESGVGGPTPSPE